MKDLYDFKQVKVSEKPPNITADWILSRISDSQIFFFYYGRFALGKMIKSPFRLDRKASAAFFIGKSGEVVYFDFSEGKPYNCFDFVKKVFNKNFNGALLQIAHDFGLIPGTTCKMSPKLMNEGNNIDRSFKSSALIQFTWKPWKEGIGQPLAFWNLYEITKEELESDGIYLVDQLFLNKVEIPTPEGQIRFAKVETYLEDGMEKQGTKIYSPYDENMKWLNSIPIDVPFGLRDLPYKSNLLIVTKSFKDRIVLKRLFTDVIATQNESLQALPQNIIDDLSKKYDRKIIIFDNDNVGVENSKKFNELGFDYFNIPEEERVRFQVKDCADYVRTFGMSALKDLFKRKNIL